LIESQGTKVLANSLQTTVEQPLRFSTGAVQPSDPVGTRTAVLVREVTLIDSGTAPTPATLMAVATDHAEGTGNQRAQRALDQLQSAVVDGTQTDMAARLKSAFRSVNADAYARGPAEVSLVAMVARGKYASFAAVGDNQAFLYRADRLNQITRNQRVERSETRRTSQRTLDSPTAPPFLGVQDRLESRLPAIFDITLLPLDAVALVGGRLADQLAHSSSTSALVAPNHSFSNEIERQVTTTGDADSAATLLEVLPAREAMPEPPVEALGTPTYLPYLITVLLLLAGLLLAIWYFFL
jgi:hypothetical protein